MMFAAIALKLAKTLVQLFEVSIHFHPYRPLQRDSQGVFVLHFVTRDTFWAYM